MSTSITIRNLKNITSLEYEIPNRPGVYVITGMNGCGKTSLLVAIHRIAHGNAFNKESRIPPPIQISIIASVLRSKVSNHPILSINQPQN